MKDFETLTKSDKAVLCQIVMDNETGAHLLGRPRTQMYAEMRQELSKAYKATLPTKRQQELMQYVYDCQYPDEPR